MNLTKPAGHTKILRLAAPTDQQPILAHVLMQGPQGQRVWWELYWQSQQICFRNLAFFAQQGSTGIACEDPGNALQVIRTVWLDPGHQLAKGPAWQWLAAESRVRAGVHQRPLASRPYGAIQELVSLASLASMPLPDARHPLWQALWS